MGAHTENIELNFITGKAEKSMSSFTKGLLKSLEKTKFDPFNTFLKDIEKAKSGVKDIQKAMTDLADADIKVKLSADELKNLMNEQKALQLKIKVAPQGSKELDDLYTRMDEVDRAYRSGTKTIKGKDTAEYAELNQMLGSQIDLVNRLNESWGVWAQNQDLDTLTNAVQELYARLKEADMVVQALSTTESGRATPEYRQLARDVKEYADAIEACGNAINKLAEKETKAGKTSETSSNQQVKSSNKATRAVHRTTRATSALGEAAKKVGKSIKNVFKSVITKAIQLPFNGLKKLNSGLMLLIKAGLGIRGLYMLFRKLRSYIQEGVNTVASGNDTVKKSVNTFSGALYQMKTALGVAIAPLVNALAPALAYIAQLATTAANAIARFFASLTGQKTVVQASINTQKYADALGDVNNALGAYDKLNVIQDDSSGSSSGVGNLIDTTTVNDEVAKMWENGDFSKLGTELATKLRDSLLGIDWKGTIYPTAQRFAESLTSFFNAAINVQDFGRTIGATIGSGIQTAIQFFYSFVTTLNWKGFGDALAAAIRGAISSIDVNMLAGTIHSLLNGAIELLISFFDPSSETFSELGTAVGQCLASLFSDDNLSETKENIATLWSNIKQSFSDFVNGLIEEIEKSNPELTNWVNFFTAVGTAIGAVIEFITNIIAALIEAGPGFTLFIVGLIAVLGSLASFLKDVLIDKLKDLFTHGTSATEATNKLKEAFGSFLEKLGTAAIIASIALALQALASVIDSLSNFIEVCGQNSDTLGQSLGTLAAVVAVVAVIIAALVVVFDSFKLGAVLLVAVIVAIAAAIKVLGEAMPPISEGIETINKSFGDLAETIGGVVTKVIEAIGDAIAKPIDSCQKLFDTCNDKLPDIINDLIEFIKQVKDGTDELEAFAKQNKSTWESASKDVSTFSTNVTNTLSKLKTSISELLTSIKTSTTTAVSSLSTSVNTSMTTLASSMSKVLNTIKSNITTNISGIKTVLSELKSYVTTMFNDSSSVFSNYGDGFKTLLNRMIGYAQQFANAIASAMDAVASSINNINIKIPSWVPNYGGKSWRPSVSGGVRVSIPYLAKGAVLPPNQPFLAMLGDQKSGTNVEAPLDTIVEAMQQALGGTTSANQPIVLQLDGKTVAKVVWDENKKRYKQTGKSYAY